MVTDLRPELARVEIPMTVLFVVPEPLKNQAEAFEASWRNAFSKAARVRLVRVEESNHYIPIDQPARFVAEVHGFMGR